MLALLLFVLAVVVWSGASLSSDGTALAQVGIQPFGGTLERVRAFGPHQRAIPLSVHGDRVTPLVKLTPGEAVTIEAVVRRPGWSSWALGALQHERLTVHAPVARVSQEWMTVPNGSSPRVEFDQPVAAVAYGSGGHLTRRTLIAGARSISLGPQPAAGTTLVAAAARPWERLGAPTPVSWFPASRTPIVVPSPAARSNVTPSSPIRLTFSQPVAQVLGARRPTLTPNIAGHWRELDSHTIVFQPEGFGAPLASTLHMTLPRALSIAGDGPSAGSQTPTASLEWTVPPGSTLRLQQLLAQVGYLPLRWSRAGATVPHTAAAEVAAATSPPPGRFTWRYPNTPGSMRALWSEGQMNTITKGAVMMFESEHGMTADGEAGEAVWRTLIDDAINGRRHGGGYNYVYVHREVPESVALWHDGSTVLTAPANTGIAGAETELGTFPVFEHIPEGTMEGTNPDGSHYKDEGIKWISYFNGGDALHNFNRASFGTPQSLGCVELPLEASAKLWHYTPIGTLVTIAA
ncbi:MAG: L,D-transpeptidase family protein [Solirubrobacterales bacterium]|nr:L,D-transpeptidase family protein [Solirubrobacterales bacterium]